MTLEQLSADQIAPERFNLVGRCSRGFEKQGSKEEFTTEKSRESSWFLLRALRVLRGEIFYRRRCVVVMSG